MRAEQTNAYYGDGLANVETTLQTEYRADQHIDTSNSAMIDILRILDSCAHERLLGAGPNVICIGTESHYPFSFSSEFAQKIDSLARENNVTFTGGGIWDMSRIWTGILVAGPCTSINLFFHLSITCAEAQTGHEEQLKMLGIGLSVREFMEQGMDKNPLAAWYSSLLEHVLSALGYRVKNSKEYAEPAVFEHPVDFRKFDVHVPAGDCVGTRCVSETETEEGVTARVEADVRFLLENETEHMFWEVNGMPTTRLRTERDYSAHATAACLFNRIPDVIAAEPGVVPVSKLGPLKHTALI